MMENINVEQIMEEIRGQIKEKRMSLDIPAFKDIPFQEMNSVAINADVVLGSTETDLDQAIIRLEGESEVPYYYAMPRGIKSVVKKVIRKTVHCVFAPVMETQNRYNRHVTEYLKNQRKAEKKKYQTLVKRIKALESENQSLREHKEK